jgi:hypothetical protein
MKMRVVMQARAVMKFLSHVKKNKFNNYHNLFLIYESARRIAM